MLKAVYSYNSKINIKYFTTYYFSLNDIKNI